MARAGQLERVAEPTTGRRSWARASAACVNLLLAALTLLPFWGWLPANHLPAGAVVLALFALSAWRPADGLVALAGLLILGVQLGAVLGAETSLQEPLLLAFLAGWLVHAAVRGGTLHADQRRVLLPASLFAATIASCALVHALAAQAVAAPFWSYVQQTVADAARDYLSNPAAVPPLRAAAPMLEGIGLFIAVVGLCRDRESVERVLRVAVAAAAGLAALNLVRFISIPLRAGAPLLEGLRAARGVRISVLGDYNAVGSYLAMMLFIAVGFAAARRRTTIGWSLMAVLIFVALWLTGSRAALLAVPLGLLAFPILWVGRSARPHFWARVAVFASALAVAVVVIARVAPPDAGLRPALNMIGGRLEMARVSLQIFRENPVFGIGLDRFLPRSAHYVRFDKAGVSRENAHNNFLQILAELGLIGLVTFVWTVSSAARRLRAALGRRDAVGAGVAAALLAFLFTCLAGHPLLTRTVSYSFWLILAAGAALVPAACSVPAARSDRAAAWLARPVRILVAAVLALVTLSIPLRADRLVQKEGNLERISSGFSAWTSDREGTTYRTVAHTADLYVRRDVCRIVVPVRSDGERDAIVELRLDGRLANRVRAPAGSWAQVAMLVPRPASADRFRALQISATGAAVRVGRIDTAICGRP